MRSRDNRTLKIFEQLGAIKRGHFILTSGNHSDTYIQCARILERPDITSRLCRQLLKPWLNQKIDVVAGPAVGGVIIAYELARIMRARAIYLERVENQLTLRRDFVINPDEKVLIVEDVVTTGGSAQEVMKVVGQYNAKPVGIVALVNRSGQTNPFSDLSRSGTGSAKFRSLIEINPPIYSPENCPLCQKGIPAVKPGSRGLK